MKILTAISAFLRWCEELITMASGPLLTAGLAIALVDLLTAGALLASQPALLYGWAISQAIGVDGQLVGASVKAGRAARRGHWLATVAYIPLIVALAGVAYLASNVFATQETFGLSTRSALAQLGMSDTTWIVARSGLAVVLVVLSGILRYEETKHEAETVAERAERMRRQLEDAQHKAALRTAQAVGWVGAGKAALAAAKNTAIPTDQDAGSDDNLSPDPAEGTAAIPGQTPSDSLDKPRTPIRMRRASDPLRGRITWPELQVWARDSLGVDISDTEALAFVKAQPQAGPTKGVPGAPISAPRTATYARAKAKWGNMGSIQLTPDDQAV